MANSLSVVFPAGSEVEGGIICLSNSFFKILTKEFYDGPVSGVALSSGKTHLIYFECVWWDDLQDNRLFKSFAVPLDIAEHRLGKIISEDAADEILERALSRQVSDMMKTAKFYIFCRSLQSVLMVLSECED